MLELGLHRPARDLRSSRKGLQLTGIGLPMRWRSCFLHCRTYPNGCEEVSSLPEVLDSWESVEGRSGDVKEHLGGGGGVQEQR